MEEEWTLYTGDEAFTEREDVRRIRVAPQVTEIRDLAFEWCTELEEIDLSNVTEIGERAFSGCRGLREVDLSNVTEIGNSAFFRCVKLKEVDLAEAKVIGPGAFSDCSSLAAVELPEGLKTIGDRAFNFCTGLKSVAIPSTVTEIENWAFADCTKLGSVTLGEGLRVIGQEAFKHCMKLESVAIPSTVTDIGGEAFQYCSKLGDVTLCEGLRVIGPGAFSDCRNLESVVLLSTVTEIGAGAFRYCTKLAAVVLPEGLQTIGQGAFDSCLLERIIIPSPAFVISAEGVGNTFQCQLSRDATTPPRDVRMIVSKHVKYMSVDRLEAAGRKINEIFGRHAQWQAQIRKLQIRKLFAYYELLDATTLLELAIWKAKMDQSRPIGRGDVDENSQKRARVDPVENRIQCRTDSGAHIILPLVTSYLGQLG